MADTNLSCPDGGTCHHGCTVSCFRVRHCSPLSAAFLNDTWPTLERLIGQLHERIDAIPADGDQARQRKAAALEALGELTAHLTRTAPARTAPPFVAGQRVRITALASGHEGETAVVTERPADAGEQQHGMTPVRMADGTARWWPERWLELEGTDDGR